MKYANSYCRYRRRGYGRTQGAILIAALVCLAIVMGLLGSMLASAIRAGRQLHAERDLRQCELLLAAGVTRAELRVAKEPGYRGETWRLPAAEIVARGDGEVTIEVALDAEQKPRQLSVIAEYPIGGERSIRRSRTVVLSTETPSE
jgi:hypothetical protein